MCIKAFCKSQFPPKIVNLSFIITIIKDKLTNLYENRLLLYKRLQRDKTSRRDISSSSHSICSRILAMVASTAVMRPRNSKCVRPPDSPCVSGVGPFSGVGRFLFGVGLIYLMYLYVYIFHLYTHMNILAMVASTAVMRPRSSRCVRPPDSPCQGRARFTETSTVKEHTVHVQYYQSEAG